MALKILAVLMLGLGLVVAACGDDDPAGDPTETAPVAATETPGPDLTPPDETPPQQPDVDAGPAEDAAIEALASWLGPVADPAAISVDATEAVTWPDGCLGVQRAGQVCTQALVEGYRIDLALGDAVYEVRTDATGDVTVWAPNLQVMAFFEEAVTNAVLFSTDDGGSLEAQPVSGTDYGVDLQSLSPGDPVGVALADAPQREGFLLVWVDPVE